jgi:hypothetical protein
MEEIPPQPTGHEPLVEVFDPRVGYTVWREAQPTHCHRRHPYRIGTASAQVAISWVGCGCDNASRGGGHEIYRCWADVEGQPCRDERWLPECVDPSRQAESNRRSG